MDQWKNDQAAPWGQLRYSTSRLNISRHLGDEPCRVLDVGGGNGLDSVYYARQGHSVTLLDRSAAMLAEATRTAQEEGVADRVTTFQADTDAIHGLFGDQRFGLVLCHLMLEFVADAHGLLRELCSLLAPGGLLSILDANRYSQTYFDAFTRNNLADAIKSVRSGQYLHPWVNRLTRRFSADELIDQLQPNGCSLAGHYGVSCITHYLPNEPKFDPQYFAQLEQLEHRLTDTYPYYLLARHYQVVARKD